MACGCFPEEWFLLWLVILSTVTVFNCDVYQELQFFTDFPVQHGLLLQEFQGNNYYNSTIK